MKVFISADIEGVTGISNWSQANHKERVYATYAKRMSEEVKAAIDGAKAAGAQDIVVMDAHGTGVNLDIDILGEGVTLIQGFNGHPDGMMYGLDETFDAAMMIGYHSPATYDGNPLAHTWSSSRIHKIVLNETIASEWLLSAMTAAVRGVPTVFSSGDARLGEHIKALHEDVVFHPTFSARGASVVYTHPDESTDAIRKLSEASLRKRVSTMSVPDSFRIEITFKHHVEAYRRHFYPGAVRTDDMSVAFESADYDEILTFIAFMMV